MALIAAALAGSEIVSAFDHKQFKKEQRCRALALSGGGSNGAWEAGVLWGFLHYGDPNDFEYDVVTGVSIGALTTYAFTHFAVGDELRFTEELSEMWSILNTENLYEQESLMELLDHTFIHKRQSLLDNTGSREILESVDFPNHEIMRRFSITALDINTGTRLYFN